MDSSRVRPRRTPCGVPLSGDSDCAWPAGSIIWRDVRQFSGSSPYDIILASANRGRVRHFRGGIYNCDARSDFCDSDFCRIASTGCFALRVRILRLSISALYRPRMGASRPPACHLCNPGSSRCYSFHSYISTALLFQFSLPNCRMRAGYVSHTRCFFPGCASSCRR